MGALYGGAARGACQEHRGETPRRQPPTLFPPTVHHGLHLLKRITRLTRRHPYPAWHRRSACSRSSARWRSAPALRWRRR